MARKQHVIMHGIPRLYSGMRDPLADTNAKLGRGRAVFRDSDGAVRPDRIEPGNSDDRRTNQQAIESAGAVIAVWKGSSSQQSRDREGL